MNKHVEIMWVQGKWVCQLCRKQPLIVYVATGHDHTDGTMRLCDCGAGVDISHVLGTYNNLNDPIESYAEFKTRDLGERPRIGHLP